MWILASWKLHILQVLDAVPSALACGAPAVPCTLDEGRILTICRQWLGLHCCAGVVHLPLHTPHVLPCSRRLLKRRRAEALWDICTPCQPHSSCMTPAVAVRWMTRARLWMTEPKPFTLPPSHLIRAASLLSYAGQARL